jgi:hypothetical protein
MIKLLLRYRPIFISKNIYLFTYLNGQTQLQLLIIIDICLGFA